MRQCTHCQAQLPEHAQFCSHCGTSAPYDPDQSLANTEADTAEETSRAEQSQLSLPPSAASATAEEPALISEKLPSETDQTTAQPPLTEITDSSDHQDAPALQAPAGSPPTTTPTTPTIEETSRAEQSQVSPLAALTPGEESALSSEKLLSETEKLPAQPPVARITDSSDHQDVPALQAPAGSPPAVTPVTPTSEETSQAEQGQISSLAALTSGEEPVLSSEELPNETAQPLAQPPIAEVADSSDPLDVPAAPSEDAPAASPQAVMSIAEMSSGEDAEPVRDQDRPDEKRLPASPPVSAPAGKRGLTARIWLVSALVILLVLAAGAGVFALLRQQIPTGAASCTGLAQAGCAPTATGGSRTSIAQLTFSGSISGPMKISALVRCQATTMENLRTLMVTLSGTVGEHFYNFGFVINHYSGPGSYNTSLTVLLDVPGEAINNGWGNMSPTDGGTITIARGEQRGSITYALSGFGTRAGTQVQVSGDWTCG